MVATIGCDGGLGTTAVVSIEDATNTGLAGTILQLVPDDVCKVRLFSERKGRERSNRPNQSSVTSRWLVGRHRGG